MAGAYDVETSSSSGAGADAKLFDSQHHCMHGTVHVNGYGHLNRMNAREGGPDCSKLSGTQLMTIWDSLCNLLAVREVSVEDVSNKSSMLLRLLHASAYSCTW
jgi:hypothetical protein